MYKSSIDLSPAAVILSTLAGGILAGFAGALLALPIAATIKVIAVDVVLASRPTHHPTTVVGRERDASGTAEAVGDDVAVGKDLGRPVGLAVHRTAAVVFGWPGEVPGVTASLDDVATPATVPAASGTLPSATRPNRPPPAG